MPRLLRRIEPGSVYHLISRFVGSEWFVRSDEERRRYLELLGVALVQCDWRCFSFAIMSNHIHLGVVAGRATLASVFRPVHTAFADWINKERKRIGAVFVRGPRARQVRQGGVARLIGYVHCNPVRAGLVHEPSASTWTSHRAYVGLATPPPWLDVATGLQLAGFECPSELDRWIATTLQRGELRTAHLEGAPRRGRPPQGRALAPARELTLEELAMGSTGTQVAA